MPKHETVVDPSRDAARTLDRKIRLAKSANLFEQVWRALFWPFLVCGLFLLASLAGLWPLLPLWVHKSLLALFALGGLISLMPLMRVRWPSRTEALRRLEQVSGVPHRPATTFDDTLPESSSDEQKALWQAHRQRIADDVGRLQAGSPRPRIDRVDPMALRAALLLVLVVSAAATAGSMRDRVASAFSFTPTPILTSLRLDAWVTPPLYTGAAPVVLAEGRDTSGQAQGIRQVTAPEKSLLLVRINSTEASAPRLVMTKSGATEAEDIEPASQEKGVTEYRVTLAKSARVEVRTSSHAITTWNFDVVEDTAPTIVLTEEPDRTPRGALRLNYEVRDDYGVAGAEALFALADNSGESQTDDSYTIQPPTFQLTLPRSNAKVAAGRTFKDLTAHPWAGLKVRMTLQARDQAGNVGESKPFDMVLPARRFTKPLARAVIEQRRNLVRSRENSDAVALALDALTIAPDKFMTDKVVFLGLRTAFWRLKGNDDVESMASVVKQLWDIALRIEDGDLPDAERALRAAQERLERAIQDGAPESEIKRLMAELRQALNKYLKTLAERAKRNGNMANMNPLGNQRMLSAQDLEQMLKKIEDLAKTGSRDLAQRMLSELRNMLERLQMGTFARNSQSERMMKTLEGLGDLITRQQKLLDDTFNAQRGENGQGQRQGRGKGEGEGQQQGQQPGQQQGRGQRPGQGKGQGRGQGKGGIAGLGDRQGDIEGALRALMEQLRGLGAKPPDQLNGAGKAMGDARGALGEQDLGRATEQQTLALDLMRQGTQSLAEQVLQSLSAQMGRGNQGNRDPFGRPERTQGPDLGTSVKVPDEIDIQRAREILEELRKRLSDPTRPLIELDYLERLIRQF